MQLAVLKYTLTNLAVYIAVNIGTTSQQVQYLGATMY